MRIGVAVDEFLGHVKGDEAHRYLSWDYCHKTFASNGDSLALELAFYLASWGMYRGSSGLLQKNHLVHKGAVDILTSDKSRKLLCNAENEVTPDKIDDILDLKNKLSEYYAEIKFKKGSGTEKNINATDTLISKIMLGTLGCIPAYDRYFKDGLKIMELKGRSFNKSSLRELFHFIEKNDSEIISAQQSIKSEIDYHYPKMKIVDICFWQIGFMKSTSREMKNKLA